MKKEITAKKYSPYGINGSYYVYDNEAGCTPMGYGSITGTKKKIKEICDELNEKEAEFNAIDINDPDFDPMYQPKDESKEVKEGGEGFTGGEWVIEYLNSTMPDEPFITDGNGRDGEICCSLNIRSPKEMSANFALMVQSKNMYYALKELDNAAMLFADEHNTASTLQIGQMLADLHNAHMKAKEVLKKANPNY